LSKTLKISHKKNFELLFKKLYPPMCSLANNYLNDYVQAEDIVQDIFIKAWEKRKVFNSIEMLKSFLHVSIRNSCINHLKHLSVINKHIKHELRSNSSDQFFYDHVIEEEVVGHLYRAINELPKGCRKIIILNLEGLSNQEIANKLNISINTVKTQKKIGLKNLRNDLQKLFLLFI